MKVKSQNMEKAGTIPYQRRVPLVHSLLFCEQNGESQAQVMSSRLVQTICKYLCLMIFI